MEACRIGSAGTMHVHHVSGTGRRGCCMLGVGGHEANTGDLAWPYLGNSWLWQCNAQYIAALHVNKSHVSDFFAIGISVPQIECGSDMLYIEMSMISPVERSQFSPCISRCSSRLCISMPNVIYLTYFSI
jgi:hypothetical protein